MSHESSTPSPAYQFKSRVLLAIIVLAEIGTLAAWAAMGSRKQASAIEVTIWAVTVFYLLALFVVTWWRLLSQWTIDLGCLLFTVGVCATWMVICLYTSEYSAAIHIEPLYLWILVIYVFAFTLAGHKSSLVISLAILAVFVGIGLPYIMHDAEVRYANFTIQLDIVSAVLIAALYFSSSYQHRLRLAQVAVDRLAELSNTDDLTQLPNRRRMTKVISAAVTRLTTQGRGFAVMLLDVDHFKNINDRFGHGAGDAALVALAARAREVLRSNDVMGRWGGDEFVILLPDIRPEDVSAKAQALCRHVGAHPLAGDHAHTISCGAAPRRGLLISV